MLLRTLFRRNLFPVVVFACFLPIAVKAQTVAAARPLIVDRVDEKSLVTLKGNTRPEARAQYDRGPVVASLPMRNLVLVLRRSPEQEAALSAHLDAMHDKASPEYHRWLTAQEIADNWDSIVKA